MKQHALKLCNCLNPQDVRALTERPQAINNRPYGFYHSISLFCNRPFKRFIQLHVLLLCF